MYSKYIYTDMYILYIYIYICMYNESYVSFNASETSLAKVTLFFFCRVLHTPTATEVFSRVHHCAAAYLGGYCTRFASTCANR